MREIMKKILVIMMALMMLVGGLFAVASGSMSSDSGENVFSTPPLSPALVSHAPIRIDSNADFDSAHGVTKGNGTESDPYIIENYDINGTGYGYCIYVGNTTDYFVIKNCSLHDASGGNIWPYYSDSGIILYNLNNGIIANNTASNNGPSGGSGIYLCYSTNNNIANNNASNNCDGISIAHSIGNNTITNNTVSNNWDSGINLYNSTTNNIKGNNVSNNWYGIHLGSSSKNTIYHNNFINNTNQAYDDIGTNSWDNGYPSGGNYWSDYNGTDDYSGSGQNESGSDGIGDTPYTNIDGGAGAKDIYPLMSPYVYTQNYLANTPWPMFHENLRHTGLSPYSTSGNNGELKWSYITGGGVYSSPAIGSDGTIYVGSWDDNLYAINPDGTLKWNYTTGTYVYSSPAIGSDGTIYIGDAKLYAFGVGGPVHNINTDEYFNTIQAAIDNTNTLKGHTIEVSAGTYFENVVVNKSLTIKGAGENLSTIDGNYNGDAVHISADWVNITGFTLICSGSDYVDAGIQLDNVRNCSIENNNISLNYYGIYLSSPGSRTFSNDTVVYATDGSETTPWGFYLPDGNITNVSSGNITYDSDFLKILVSGDAVYNATDLGWFWFDNVTGYVYFNNTDWDDPLGNYGITEFYAYYTCRAEIDNSNVISNNTISNNNYYGIYTHFSANNTIYHNSFINNTNQAYDDIGTNSWDNGYPSGGNYWSDYNGTDDYSGSGQNESGSDGIGDTPYTNIDGGAGAMDNYPLLPVNSTDTNPPEHSDEYPSDGSSINNPSPTIWVHITDESSVNESSIKLYVNGFNVFITKSQISGGYNVSYIHEGEFSDGQVVTCRIVAEDIYGNRLDWTWNFTVDLTAPYVDSVSPADGEENVTLNRTIEVTFSESVDHLSAESAFRISPVINGSLSWNGSTMIFTPASLLASGTIYTVTIDANATDCAGNPLAADYSWSFNTLGDATPPEHSNENPGIDGYTSDLTPVISVHVTDLNGVDADTIRLYVQGYNINYNLVSIANGYNVSYWHEAGFSDGEVVTCRIVADDIYGNHLDFTWNFTVQNTVSNTFDIPVHLGWNLISYPLLASGYLETVLNDTNVIWDNTQWYDPTDTGDHWKTHVVGRSINDLNSIDNTMAIWLHVTDAGDGYLTVSGDAPVSTAIQLHAGWNLVSYPASSSSAINSANLPAQVTKIARYDENATYLLSEVADWTGNSFVPGRGYWLYATADTTWTIDY